MNVKFKNEDNIKNIENLLTILEVEYNNINIFDNKIIANNRKIYNNNVNDFIESTKKDDIGTHKYNRDKMEYFDYIYTNEDNRNKYNIEIYRNQNKDFQDILCYNKRNQHNLQFNYKKYCIGEFSSYKNTISKTSMYMFSFITTADKKGQ